MRAEPWPITCRARSRSRVPPASTRARGPVALVIGMTTAVLLVAWRPVRSSLAANRAAVLMSAHPPRPGDHADRRGTAGSAGGVQGAGDLLVAEAGLAGGDGQGAEVGGRVGVEGAVGGPEQARVAVSLGLAGDPAGQVGQVEAGSRARLRRCWLALGFEQPGDCVPVQAAAAAGPGDELVGLAVDLGGRGEDVSAVRPEVEVVAGQAAVVLVRSR